MCGLDGGKDGLYDSIGLRYLLFLFVISSIEFCGIEFGRQLYFKSLILLGRMEKGRKDEKMKLKSQDEKMKMKSSPYI